MKVCKKIYQYLFDIDYAIKVKTKNMYLNQLWQKLDYFNYFLFFQKNEYSVQSSELFKFSHKLAKNVDKGSVLSWSCARSSSGRTVHTGRFHGQSKDIFKLESFSINAGYYTLSNEFGVL